MLVQRKSQFDRGAMMVLFSCCAFWGFQQILIKSTVAEVAPLWQATLRFAGATVMLWGWCRWRGIPLFERDGTWRAGLLTGALFTAEFACIYLSMRYTTASRVTVFLYTAPFVVALLLPRFVPSERLGRWQWLGLCVAFVSMITAFGDGLSHSTPEQLKGDAIALASGVLWGLTILSIRTTRMAFATPEKTLFYQVAMMSLVAPVLSWWLGEPRAWQYSAMAWTSVFLQSAVGGFASFLAWMWLLRHYPATQTASLVFLTPVFALLFGVSLLGEPLTLQLMLALAGVAFGIVLVSRRRA